MARKQSFWWGCIAGAVGGALGTVLLNIVQKTSLETTRTVEDIASSGYKYTEQQEQLLAMFEQAHVATAEAFGVKVSNEKRMRAALCVEFAFGIVCGAAYGAAVEYLPAAAVGFGSVYGAILFTGASEIVLPAIGFVPPPADRTFIQHVGGLGGNAVYGVAVEAVRRLLRMRG